VTPCGQGARVTRTDVDTRGQQLERRIYPEHETFVIAPLALEGSPQRLMLTPDMPWTVLVGGRRV
jgi:hypothetical protein